MKCLSDENFSAVKFELRSFQFYRRLQQVLFYIKEFVSCILDYLLHDITQLEVDNIKWLSASFITDLPISKSFFFVQSGWRLVMSKSANFYLKPSSLDRQRICVNRQLKSSKKQLELNVCVPKCNSVDRYTITCDVIAYHLVHFVSLRVIYKCQSGIDFFY